MSRKVVINTCFGGFSLSALATKRLAELNCKEGDVERDNPKLVQVVEELGEKANGPYAELSIVEIPDDVEWEIDEYDGNEHIAEKHRTWR